MEKFVKYWIIGVSILFAFGAGMILGGKLNESYFETYVLGDGGQDLRRPNSDDFQQLISDYSGMDVWRELNAYRISKGLNEIQLSDAACANIPSRWTEVYKNFEATGLLSHDGILDFRKNQEKLGFWPTDYGPAELLNYGSRSAKETIESLAGSPSHGLELSKAEHKFGCVHSQSGLTVIFLHPTL